MSNNDKKILNLERGRQLFLFLFCLFLAFVIWTVHKLSDQYSQFFQYRVYATVSVKGRATDSESLNKLIIRGRASGFYILQHRLSKGGAELSLSPGKLYLKKVKGKKDLFYFLTSDIRDIIVSSIEDKVIADYISADTIFFNYPEVGGKEVPVAVKSRASFKEQYMPTGGFKLTPSTIMISGDAELIKNIDSVYTTNINIYNTDSPVSGFAKLEPTKGISYSEEQVFYSLEVERYFEEVRRVRVNLLNIPDSVIVSFVPDTLSLIFRCSMKNAEPLIDNNLSAIIDFKSLKGSHDTLAIAIPAIIPQGIINFRTDPPYVHCRVLLKNKER